MREESEGREYGKIEPKIKSKKTRKVHCCECEKKGNLQSGTRRKNQQRHIGSTK
jgi:hypothetical protein